MPLADQKILGSMFYVVNDIERIGDHAENFADYTKTELKHNTGLTGDAKEEIKKMYEAVSKLLKLSLESFMAQDGVNTQEDKLAEIAAWKLPSIRWNAATRSIISNVLPKVTVSQELVYYSLICFLN